MRHGRLWCCPLTQPAVEEGHSQRRNGMCALDTPTEALTKEDQQTQPHLAREVEAPALARAESALQLMQSLNAPECKELDALRRRRPPTARLPAQAVEGPSENATSAESLQSESSNAARPVSDRGRQLFGSASTQVKKKSGKQPLSLFRQMFKVTHVPPFLRNGTLCS